MLQPLKYYSQSGCLIERSQRYPYFKRLNSETDAQPRDASITSRRYQVRQTYFLYLVRGYPSSLESIEHSVLKQDPFCERVLVADWDCAFSAFRGDPGPRRWFHSRAASVCLTNSCLAGLGIQEAEGIGLLDSTDRSPGQNPLAPPKPRPHCVGFWVQTALPSMLYFRRNQSRAKRAV